jgi:predicted GIY-YIG superfamily endonuclease
MKFCKECECIYPDYYKECPSCSSKIWKEYEVKNKMKIDKSPLVEAPEQEDISDDR